MVEFPKNTSIDFDESYRYIIRQSRKVHNFVSTIACLAMMLYLYLLISFPEAFILTTIMFVIAYAAVKLFIHRYAKLYFDSKQAQDLRYSIIHLNKEFKTEITSIRETQVFQLTTEEFSLAKRNMAKVLLKKLNVEIDEAALRYFVRLAEIEAKINHTLAKNVQDIPKVVKNFHPKRLFNSFGLECDKIKESENRKGVDSIIFPIYSFECINQNGNTVNEFSVVLNADTLQKIVSEIKNQMKIKPSDGM